MKKAGRNPIFGFVFLGAVLILLAVINLYFGSVKFTSAEITDVILGKVKIFRQ